MSHADNDPLWDPRLAADPELERLCSSLSGYGLRARGYAEWKPRHRLQRGRRVGILLATAATVVLAVLVVQQWRLAWQDQSPWSVRAVAGTTSSPLLPGAAIETAAQESVSIAVARIGSIQLSPQSSLRLIETRAGHHRVDLQRGHLRARIWAPPGYFGVVGAGSEVIDLGCDFDLWKQADGRGTVQVRSGWIAYRVGKEEILVPADYAMSFDGQHASTPIRVGASAALTAAVAGLERRLESEPATSSALQPDAARVAAAATDADAYTLLNLLSRYPGLAQGPLYPRLASALHVDDDAAHRQAWAKADQNAIEAWWKRLPRQPKSWWANWLDALPLTKEPANAYSGS